ncbi:MAG: magnesium transporter [Rickettsiales bacterium]|nr:MAG: magnesium transporter [Rickettsiales bacterium]
MQNAILPDHQDRFAEQFAHITYLINNDRLGDAIDSMLDLHYADLADFLDNTPHKLYPVIFPAITSRLNPETIACLSDANKQPAIESIGIAKSAKLIDDLDIEDSIEIAEALSPDLKDALLAQLSPAMRQQIIEGFLYPEDTVGRALEKDFVSFGQHWTAGQAIDFIRRSDISADFHAAIIVSPRDKPVGTILLSTLLKSERNTPLEKIMSREFKSVDAHTALDDLAFIFKQYALTIVPVITRQGKLLGTISIDNMLYIVEDQAESELLHLAGIHNTDIFHSLRTTVRHRFPWLFVNLIFACLTSLVINQFSGTIAKLVTLATIMPIVASMGGSAGTQAMTVTIRALGSREITSSSTSRVVTKEVLSCALNGIILAFIGMMLTYLLFSDIYLSLVFAAAVVINFTLAGLFGSSIPIMLNNMEIDPAAASGVFLTTCTDAIGFFSFLGLAYFFLV